MYMSRSVSCKSKSMCLIDINRSSYKKMREKSRHPSEYFDTSVKNNTLYSRKHI